MAAGGNTMLDKIQIAYADAVRAQPAEYPPLPAWFKICHLRCGRP